MGSVRQNPRHRNPACRCFLTGVEMGLDQAYVINRRGARELLFELSDRVCRLRRLIEQLAPLDSMPVRAANANDIGPAPRRHRLVCAEAALVMAQGFSEVTLFLAWPDYRARVRKASATSPTDGRHVEQEAVAQDNGTPETPDAAEG